MWDCQLDPISIQQNSLDTPSHAFLSSLFPLQLRYIPRDFIHCIWMFLMWIYIYFITLLIQLVRLIFFFCFTTLQRTHYSLALKITELYDSVKRKRIDLGVLQRTKTLSTILEAQVRLLALDGFDCFVDFTQHVILPMLDQIICTCISILLSASFMTILPFILI